MDVRVSGSSQFTKDDKSSAPLEPRLFQARKVGNYALTPMLWRESILRDRTPYS